MDQAKCQDLIYYLTTHKYPNSYKTDAQKRQLRKISAAFVVKNGELYHIREGQYFDEQDKHAVDSQKVIVQGSADTSQIIQDVHCHGLLGKHVGFELTLEKIATRYWWPRLNAEVREFIKKCDTCKGGRSLLDPKRIAQSEAMKRRWAAYRDEKERSRQMNSSGAADNTDDSGTPRTKRPRLFLSGPIPATTGELEKSVLQLQQQVYEAQLQYQVEKKAAISKFNLALDEFRRHVAEQRMVARGVNISNVPVDIPPGLDGVGL